MNPLIGNPLTREALAFAILVGVLVLGAVVMLVLRTRSLPSAGTVVSPAFTVHTLATVSWTAMLGPAFSIHIGARGAYTASTALDLPACADIPARRPRLLQLDNSSGLTQSRKQQEVSTERADFRSLTDTRHRPPLGAKFLQKQHGDEYPVDWDW